MNDEELARKIQLESNIQNNELNETDIKSMVNAMRGSPEIRKTLEHLLDVIIRVKNDMDKSIETKLVNFLELNTVMINYIELSTNKRLARIERHLEIKDD